MTNISSGDLQDSPGIQAPSCNSLGLTGQRVPATDETSRERPDEPIPVSPPTTASHERSKALTAGGFAGSVLAAGPPEHHRQITEHAVEG